MASLRILVAVFFLWSMMVFAVDADDFVFEYPYSEAMADLKNATAECSRLSGFDFANGSSPTVDQLSRMCDKPSCASLLNRLMPPMTYYKDQMTNLAPVSKAYYAFGYPMLNYCWYFRTPSDPCPADPWTDVLVQMKDQDAECKAQTSFSFIGEDNATRINNAVSNLQGICDVPACVDQVQRLWVLYNLYLCKRNSLDGIQNGQIVRDTVVLMMGMVCNAHVQVQYEFRRGPSLPLNVPFPTSSLPPVPTAMNTSHGSQLEDPSSSSGSSSSSTDGSLAINVGDREVYRKNSKRTKYGSSEIPSGADDEADALPSDGVSLKPSRSTPSTTKTASAPSPTDPSGSDASASNPSAGIQPSDTAATSESGTSLNTAVAIPSMMVVIVGILFVFVQRRRVKAAAPSEDMKNQYVLSSTPSVGDLDVAAFNTEDDSLLESSTTSSSSWNSSRILLTKAVPIDCLQDIRLIGTGAHGVVFLVKDTRTNQLLASKRLVKNHQTVDKIEMFVAEIQLVSTLHHPCVVSFMGATWTNRTDVQALFEYMDGGDLRTHLDVTPVCGWTREKLSIAIDIADALAYVHSALPTPVVHRDLKSRNVLLSHSPRRAKLSDFGVARRVSENYSMTTGVGTSRWLAPEVILGGGEYDAACDIYSFGVVLSELDTHRVPFGDCFGSVPGSLLPEIAILSRVGLDGLQPSFSESCMAEILSLARRCLSYDRRDRPSAVEVAEELRRLVRDELE